ncbi:hypothetical protein VHUM_01034 [Vanrija humicola]|uniref:BRCT domain-containing protein n=1 Tax=Vanrija humicola TaxID=5417 RepID=A0A7D8V3U3_VANHU|nr:hypothetical protein VHUM_01034 [Vanrija humicola]
MPSPPPSSPEIICISPPTIPGKPTSSKPASPTAHGRAARAAAIRAAVSSSSSSPYAAPSSSRRKVTSSQSRSRVTERMLNSMTSDDNPITHSNAFANTDHVHSCSTGHQQRGGDRGFWATARDLGLKPEGEKHTYWSVRTAKVEAGAREKLTPHSAGCVIAINGPTGPKVSNLQLQNLITANGGRFAPHIHSGCTHVVAERLSGSKSQKYINGQGSRGASRRSQVVKVEWVLDCVAKGRRISEAGYSSVEDPVSVHFATVLTGRHRRTCSARLAPNRPTPYPMLPTTSILHDPQPCCTLHCTSRPFTILTPLL